MDEQEFLSDAKALADRLWNEFQNEVAGEKQPLYYPRLAQDEVEIIREVYRSLTCEGIDWMSSSFKNVWGKDGLVFLACITYARYGTQKGVGFWEGLSTWITGSAEEIDTIRDYHSLRRFFSRHNLPLEKNGDKHLYVTSLYIHARIPPKHIHRIVPVLAKIIDRFPFFLDDDLLHDIVKEFVEEMSGSLLIEEYRYLVRDDDNDDHNGNLSLSSVASLFQYLPNSLLFAGLKNKEATVRALIPLYEVVERIILSDHDWIVEEVELGGLWELRESLSPVSTELREARRNNGVSDRTRNPVFRRFRTPTVFFDFTSSEVKLFFPEQRLDSETRDELMIVVESTTHPLVRTQATVRVYTAGDIWRLTEETTFLLPHYTDDLAVTFSPSDGEVKKFPITDRWLILDSEGRPVKGTPTPGSDVYILVEKSVDFQCNGSEVEFDGSELGFRLHHLFLEKDTVFFVDGKAIAPCLDRVPEFSIDDQNRVNDAFVTPEGDHEDHVPVYREFPAFSFRVGEDVNVNERSPLIINGSRVSYDVRRDVPVADGSGDRLVEIFPFAFASQAGTDIYAGQFAGPHGGSFKFAVLYNLHFDFEKRLSTDQNRPRVMNLSFDRSEQAFTRNYEFPSPPGTTRFRMELGETDYKLHVQPHQISWSLLDGEPLSDHVNLSVVAQKELLVRYSSGSCRVVATPSDGSVATFPLTSRMNAEGVAPFPLRTLQNIRSGSIALSIIVSNPSWGKMEFERVDVCTIHTSFAFLDGPTIQLNTVGSVLSKHLPPGNYVSYKAIGDGRSQYMLSVLDKSGNSIATTQILADGSRHESFLMELISDGRYSIKVVRVRRLMGRTESSVEEVFTGEPFVLRHGIPKDGNDLTGEVFRCVEAIQDALLNNGKSIRVKRPVENFYLRVTETISESPDEFLADGFFFLNGREQNQYDHNPYRLRVLERNGEKIKLRISDAYGAGIRVDRHKHVNSHSKDSQLQTHKIVVVSDIEGGNT